MKYVISMTFLKNGSAAENKAAQKELLDLYAKWQPPAGMTIREFLSRCDAGGAFTVVETDNAADLIGVTSKFGYFADYQIYPVVEVADGVQAAQESFAFLGI